MITCTVVATVPWDGKDVDGTIHMNSAKSEVQSRVDSALARNDFTAAVEIIRSYILSLGVDVFSVAVHDQFEEGDGIQKYIETFVSTVSRVRIVKSLTLQLDEVDLGTDNWVCWPATAPVCFDPNESDEAHNDFVNKIQGPEGYAPYALQGFQRMKVAFDWYRLLTSAERSIGNRQVAKEFAYRLVVVRFYQFLRFACDELMATGRIPRTLCVFAEEYGGDFFYCVTHESLGTSSF